MSDLKQLTDLIIKFRNERNWKQFHNPKDVSLSLVLEASEVMEHFQWKNDTEIKVHVRTHKDEIAAELSDVLFWVLLLSHDLKIDLKKSFLDKLKVSKSKYPISKSRGKHLKYTDL